MNGQYKPSGELQGDDKGIPDKGTSTGMPSNAATEGMDTSQSAENTQGSIRRSTKSDGMEAA
jgi:hypothetical protein